MSPDFFQSKKPWSPYKDMILAYYLKPYLPKVCSLGKPVVVFDCFAGPGRFDDGADGSPLIIAKAVRQIADKGKAVSAIFYRREKEVLPTVAGVDEWLSSRLQGSTWKL